jgi:hypothetical protein
MKEARAIMISDIIRTIYNWAVSLRKGVKGNDRQWAFRENDSQ